MPGEIRQYLFCGSAQREIQYLYMTIDCDEQERTIKHGYLKRWEKEIIDFIIIEQVHRLTGAPKRMRPSVICGFRTKISLVRVWVFP